MATMSIQQIGGIHLTREAAEGEAKHYGDDYTVEPTHDDIFGDGFIVKGMGYDFVADVGEWIILDGQRGTVTKAGPYVSQDGAQGAYYHLLMADGMERHIDDPLHGSPERDDRRGNLTPIMFVRVP